MSNWEKIPGKDLFEAVRLLFTALGEHAGALVKRLVKEGPAGARKIAASMLHDSFVLTPEQEKAKRIMGVNFYPPCDSVRLLGIIPSPVDLKALGEIPFSDTALKACRNTHVLIAVFPVSIRELIEDYGHRECFDRKINLNHPSIDSPNQVSWQLVRVTDLSSHLNFSFEDQKLRIKEDEILLTAHIIAYTMLLHFLATKKDLFGELTVRVSDSTDRLHQVMVDSYQGRIRFSRCWNNEAFENISIALGKLSTKEKVTAEAKDFAAAL